MINFVLDQIQLRNVRCYGDDIMTMDFPINNLTVFTGRVGSGKSTILKAVSLALYGEDGGAKGEKLSIDDIINEKNGKNLEIHLYFHSYIDDNKNAETKYEIHLFHKHTKYNNKLVFVKDGRDISLESKTATYELIEKTLIPKNVYHNIYYFTQQAKNFFTALPNTEQKEIFNAILDLSEYSSYYDNVKHELDDIKLKCDKDTTSYGIIQENIKNLKDFIDNKKMEHSDKVDKSNKRLLELDILSVDLQNDIDRVMEQLDKFDNVDDELVKLEMSNQEKRLTLERDLNKINEKIDSIDKNFNDNVLPTLKQKYIDLRNNQVKDIQNEIQKIKSNIELFKTKNDKQISDINTKYSKIISDKKESFNNSIADIKEDIGALEMEISKLDSACIQNISNETTKSQNEINEIKDKLNKHTGNKTLLDVNLSKLRDQFKECTSKITEYKEALNKPDAVCSLCGQKLVNKDHIQKHIDNIEKQLEEIKKQGIDYKSQLENEVKEIEACNSKIKDISEKFVQKKQELLSQKELDSKNFKDKLSELRSKLSSMDMDFQNELTIINDIDKKKEVDALLKEFMDYTTAEELKIQELTHKQTEIDAKIKEDYKVELDSSRQDVSKQKFELSATIQPLKDKYNEYVTNEYNPIYQKLKTKKVLLDNLKQQQVDLTSSLNECKHEIEIIKNNLTSDEDAYNTSIQTYESKYKVELDKQKKMENDINLYQKQIKILEFWKTAFSDSGIKSMLIDSAIPHMNACVRDELEKSAPGMFTVSFDTLSETKSGKVKDKFSVNVLNNKTQSKGHKKLSGGEKRIIDLCCMSALRSLAEKLYGKRFHHIFYDEILDSLDDECKQAFCAHVKSQSTNECNVTLVTHDLPEDVDPDRVFPF